MTTEQINLIKRIGNDVFEIMKKGNNFNKYMTMLEGTAKAHQLRTVLIRIVKMNYNSNNENPIITFEEWVNYLFPDGQYWGEVRDLLLIFLYEKLHIHNINVDVIDESDIVETEEEVNEGA